MDEPESTKPLHRVYRSTSPAEATRVYDDWAAGYEADMLSLGYTHPALVAAVLARHLAPAAGEVLDAGCGTGIMAEILTALGYGPLVGLDASEGMLARAAEKGQYAELLHARLGEPLPFADGRFAAVVAAGVFTQGHAPLDGLDELVRATAPGGVLAFSVARTYLEGPFEEKSRTLEAAGRWRRLEASERYNSAPLADSLISQVFAYRRT